MTQLGICKFCEQKRELINSHIIPKCFYQLKTFGKVVTIDAKKQKINLTRDQNGHKEPLLCAECDNHLGLLDEYANELLFHIIPKHKFQQDDNYLLKAVLQAGDFNYNKLRRFFISLVWRASVCKLYPYSLGLYEKIALKILKFEAPDNGTLFLPLIYRKRSNIPVDEITGIFLDNFLGQHNFRFRFPNYEVVVLTDTKNTNNKELTNDLKKMFTREELIIYELTSKTSLDNKLIVEMVRIQESNKHLRPSKK